jgi:hypothetical protein
MRKFRIIISIFFTCLPVFLLAQPGFGDDVPDVPIDGGLSLLVAAGAGYGAKRLQEKRRAEKK